MSTDKDHHMSNKKNVFFFMMIMDKNKKVQDTRRIPSNMSDLLFFYHSLFLYSLRLADVAGRFKAV